MNYAGIDYGMGLSNKDPKSDIRYGVIPHHDVGQTWYEESEGDYGLPCCPACGEEVEEDISSMDFWCRQCEKAFWSDQCYGDEPLSHYFKDDEYFLHQSYDNCDIWVERSPYWTYAQYCSPCAPGAGYLRNAHQGSPEEAEKDGFPKVFCLGHDWFESGQAPYPVYRVSDGLPVVAEVQTDGTTFAPTITPEDG